MNLLITISGCGGGHMGPQEIYPCLQKNYGNGSLKILPFETLPDNIQDNVNRVSEIALKNLDSFENIYLIGHSMGGAVAALAAHKLNETTDKTVKGLVLINPQTEGLQVLKKLTIPVLFYHGKEDQIFPTWQIESTYNAYSGPKRMIELEGLDHDLTQDSGRSKSKKFKNDLTKDLFSEISKFFFNGDIEEIQRENEILSRAIPCTPQKSFMETLSSIFKSFGN